MANKSPVYCLGIESSCDETAAAIVDGAGRIISHTIYSQIPEHQRFGGVVPELAARAHILAIDEVVKKTIADAGLALDDIDVVAATAGPGLIGGVIVGWEFASGLAMARGLPLVAVNHLEGHALACQLSDPPKINPIFEIDAAELTVLARAPGHNQRVVDIRGLSELEKNLAAAHGLNLADFAHRIDTSAVRHIFIKHGNDKIEKSRGQIAITDDNLKLIPEVIAAPDFMVFGIKNRVGRDAIAYIKNISGRAMIYIAEIRTKRRCLATDTLYKKSGTIDAKSPILTALPDASTDDIIDISAANVKPAVDFPYLLLLASGGHSQILVVRGVGKYELLGETLDDSAGESFDKVAKMLGLGYPGGPAVERAAARGDARAFDFPRPLCGRKNCDFSFSGIKTAARTILDKMSVNIIGDELGDFYSMNDFRQKAVDWYKCNLEPAILRHNIIGNIRFSKKGRKEYEAHSANPDKLRSIIAIKDIIQNGRYMGFVKTYKLRRDNVSGFHHFLGRVNIGGRYVWEEILVCQDENGCMFYDLFIRNEESDGSTKSQIPSPPEISAGIIVQNRANVKIRNKKSGGVPESQIKAAPEISARIMTPGGENVEGGFVADFCASFQQAVIDVILNRLENAIARAPDVRTLVVAGGVAANRAIRAVMERLAAARGMRFAAPPLGLCTDNGAMIAWAGIRNFAAGNIVRGPVAPRPRWPLSEL